MTEDRKSDALTLVLGTIIVLATIGAYLYAQTNEIEVDALLAFVVPVVSALLIVRQVDKVHATTKTVERQTNGELTRRLESHRQETTEEVRRILADTLLARDVAKTAAVAQLGAGSTVVDPRGSSTPAS